MSLECPTRPRRVESVTASASQSGAESAVQGVVLSLLYALPAIYSIRSSSFVADNDIWWHLAAGRWILQHRSLPRTDPFSLYGMGKPWAAYSWGFELPAAWLVAHFGLLGLVLLHFALATAVIVVLHRMIAHRVPDFTIAAALTASAAVAMNSLFTPRPWLLTILFFFLELHIVLDAWESGKYRRLWLLPFIFCLWANVHVQFVYGGFLLVLVAGDAWLSWWKASDDASLRRARNVWTVTALLCAAATLLNPYFLGIYKVAYELGTQAQVMDLISELGAVPFRSFPNYLLLLIALAAVAALAWRREVRAFPWALLLWSVVFSLRTQRDSWLVAGVGAIIIADSLRGQAVTPWRRSRLQVGVTAIGTVLVILATGWLLGLSNQSLQATIAARYPADAVEAVKQKGLTGPLFNDFGWGGYLIWKLPEIPVSMDGRAQFHGTPRIVRSVATWQGAHDWNSDAELQNAHLVIGKLDAPLCALLRMDARYELVYEDKVASVFVRRTSR